MLNSKAEHFLNRGQHEHNDKSDFRTPKFLFQYIEDKFGKIDYDGACIDGLNNLAKSLRLDDEWPIGSTVYSNPPFDSGSIEKWFDKGELHAKNGGMHIMCLPEKICQVFFNRMIIEFEEIVFLGGRINFVSPYAVKGGASMSGTILTRQGGKKYYNSPIISGTLIRDIKHKYS